MAKHKRKRFNKDSQRFYEEAVFLGSNTDGSNETKSQVDLEMGSDEYEDMIEDRSKEARVKEEEFHTDLERNNESLRRSQIDKHEITAAFRTGQRKYNRYMSKEVKVGKMKDIIESGLDKRIPRKDFDDELYDDGISGDEFPVEAARDHKQEFEKLREIPTIDTDKDGVKDEPVMTPGMKRLSKYM